MSTNTNEVSLLPCPFCGGKADLAEDTDRPGNPWTVFCEFCDSRTRNCMEPDQAITVWNTRATIAAAIAQPEVTHITWNADGVRTVNGVPDFVPQPPSAAMQPLTDEQIEKVWSAHKANGDCPFPSEVTYANRFNLVRAIEADYGITKAAP